MVDAIAAAEADDDDAANDVSVVVEEGSIGNRSMSMDRPPAAARKPKAKPSSKQGRPQVRSDLTSRPRPDLRS